MNFNIEDYLNKLEEYSEKYDVSDDIEKIEITIICENYFDKILNHNILKKLPVDILEKIHSLIIKLNCVLSLATFHAIIAPVNFDKEYNNLIIKDINKLVLMAKNVLNPFIKAGLDYQINKANKYNANAFDYGNYTLNKYGNGYNKNILCCLDALENNFKRYGINENIFNKFFSLLKVEELAFIYAQLCYFEYNGNRFQHGTFENCTHELCERIYHNMWMRSDSDKFKFIETVYKFGYSGQGYFLIAMFVDLYSRYNTEDLCKRMYPIFDLYCNYRDPFSLYEELEVARNIKRLRDEDLKNGKKPLLISEYSVIENSCSYRK